MNSSAIDNGLTGIRQGMQGMAKAASTVASNIHSPCRFDRSPGHTEKPGHFGGSFCQND
jgi:hypothetical protein